MADNNIVPSISMNRTQVGYLTTNSIIRGVYLNTTTTLAPSSLGNPRPQIVKDPFAEFLEIYYSILLLVIGTIGNLLSLAVLSRKAFRSSPIGICLRFLALADMTALYTGPLYFTSMAIYGYNARLKDDASCRFHRWVAYTSVDLSAWTLVVVSTARLASVVWPMRNIFNRKRTYITLIVTLIVIIGINSPTYFLYGIVITRSGRILCAATKPSYRYFTDYVWVWIVFVKLTFLPGVILLVMNIFLVTRVIQSRQFVDEMRGGSGRRKRISLSFISKTKSNFRKWASNKDFSRESIMNAWRGRFGGDKSTSIKNDMAEDLKETTEKSERPVFKNRVTIYDELTSDFKVSSSEYRTSMETILSTVTENELMNSMYANRAREASSFTDRNNHRSSNGDACLQIAPSASRSKSERDISLSVFPKSLFCSEKKNSNSSLQNKLNRRHSLNMKMSRNNNKAEEEIASGLSVSDGLTLLVGSRNGVVERKDQQQQPTFTNSNALLANPTSDGDRTDHDSCNDDSGISCKDSDIPRRAKSRSETSLVLPVIEVSMESSTDADPRDTENNPPGVVDIDDVIVSCQRNSNGKEAVDEEDEDTTNTNTKDTTINNTTKSNNIKNNTTKNNNTKNNNNDSDGDDDDDDDEDDDDVDNKSLTNDAQHTQSKPVTAAVATTSASTSASSSSDVINTNPDVRLIESEHEQTKTSQNSLCVITEQTITTEHPDTLLRVPDFKCTGHLRGRCTSMDSLYRDGGRQDNTYTETDLISIGAISNSDSSIQGPNEYWARGSYSATSPRRTAGGSPFGNDRSRRGGGGGGDQRNHRHRNLTVTVIVVNAIFLLCNLPIAVYMSGREYMFTGKKRVNTPQYVMEICSNYILYTSNAINFILYCITGSRFRQECKNMFTQWFSFVSRCWKCKKGN